MTNKGRGIDEIIAQAMREGAFDNLAGKGKPLDLTQNPHIDPEWQMAYHLLKENGFAPEFIERRQLIENGLASARTILSRTWTWKQNAEAKGENPALVEAEWGKARAAFENVVEKLNKEILSYNLSTPSPNFHRRKIDIEAELANLGKS
jgi:DnaJ family protein C protein 28